MKKELKVALGVLVTMLCAVAVILLLGFSDELERDAATVVAGVAVAVVAGVVAGVATAGVATTGVAAVVAVVVVAAAVVVAAVGVAAAAAAVVAVVVVAAVAAVAVAAVADSDQQKKISLPIVTALVLCFAVPVIVFTPIVAKYHNLTNLKKDEILVKAFEISVNEGEVIITLPDASHNSYLEKVLMVGSGTSLKEELIGWRDLAVRCTEGKKVWYKATLVLPEASSVKFLFDHLYQDYESIVSLVNK